MIAGFKPHPDCKHSGVEWLGDIPVHWEVRKTVRLFSIGSGTTPSTQRSDYYGGGIPWLTTSEVREGLITSTLKTVTEKALKTFPALKTYPIGSVVVAMYGATIGRVGVLGVSTTVNQACCVFSDSKEMDAWFLFYWFQSERSHLISLGYGGGQPNLSMELLKSIRVPIPPFAEQTAIVRYLDHADGCIRRYIDAKERLIGLLKEQRQAVIHRAVTRGLNPDIHLKPSGVEWLGNIPAHWEVLPNRAIFSEVNEREHPQREMLSVTITRGVIRQQALLEDSSKKDASRLDKSAYKLVEPGDIAYNKMRAWQGAIGVSEYSGIVSPAYVVQRTRGGANSRYVHYLLRTPAFSKEAERWSYGITSDMWSLRPEHFKMIYTCLPPLAEQTAIVEYLDKVTADIDDAIDHARRQIELLNEYRTRLIADVVTGKLDVREAAAGLPKETREDI